MNTKATTQIYPERWLLRKFPYFLELVVENFSSTMTTRISRMFPNNFSKFFRTLVASVTGQMQWQ